VVAKGGVVAEQNACPCNLFAGSLYLELKGNISYFICSIQVKNRLQ